MSSNTAHSYEFENFRLDLSEKVLFCDDKPVSITPKAFETLQVFVENAGHLLEKDELMQRIWQDRFVEESNLAFNIKILRRVLNDDAHQPRFIETVPRRGYRFIATVKERFDDTCVCASRRSINTSYDPASVKPNISVASLSFNADSGFGCRCFIADAIKIVRLDRLLRRFCLRPLNLKTFQTRGVLGR